jgi:hypothetical protein
MAAESSALVGGGAAEVPPALQAMATLPLDLGEEEVDSTDKTKGQDDNKEAVLSAEEAPVDTPPRAPM